MGRTFPVKEDRKGKSCLALRCLTDINITRNWKKKKMMRKSFHESSDYCFKKHLRLAITISVIICNILWKCCSKSLTENYAQKYISNMLNKYSCYYFVFFKNVWSIFVNLQHDCWQSQKLNLNSGQSH